MSAMNKQSPTNSISSVEQKPACLGFNHCLGPQQQRNKRLQSESLQTPRQGCDDKPEAYSKLVPSSTHTCEDSLRRNIECNIDDDSFRTHQQHDKRLKPETLPTPRQGHDSNTETHSSLVLSSTRTCQDSLRSNEWCNTGDDSFRTHRLYDKGLKPETLPTPGQEPEDNIKTHSTLVPSQTHTREDSLRSNEQCNTDDDSFRTHRQFDKRLEPEPLPTPRQGPDARNKTHSTLVPSHTHTHEDSLVSYEKCNSSDDSLRTQPQHGEGLEPQTLETSRHKSGDKPETHSKFFLSQTYSHQVSVRSNVGDDGLQPQNFHKPRDEFRKRSNKECNAGKDDLRPVKLHKTREELGDDSVYPTENIQISTAETSHISSAQPSQISVRVKQEVEVDSEECRAQNLCLASVKNRETCENYFQPQHLCSAEVMDENSVNTYKKLFHLHNLGLVRVRHTNSVENSKNSCKLQNLHPGRTKDGDNVEFCDNSFPSKNLAQIPECSMRVRQEVKHDGAAFQQQNLCLVRGRGETCVETDKNSPSIKNQTSEFSVRIKEEVVSDNEEFDQQNCHKTRGIGVHSYQKTRANNFEISSNSFIDRSQDQRIPNKAPWINQPATNISMRTNNPFMVNFGGSKFPDENNSKLCRNQQTTNSVMTTGPFVVNFGNVKSELTDGNGPMFSIPNQQQMHNRGVSSAEFGDDASDESDCDMLPVHFQEQDEEEESFEQEKFYVCGICDSAHHIPYDLSEHFSHHVRDDRSFRCGSCQKTFQHIAHLTQHVLVHTFASGSEFQQNDPNSFACHMCSKMFRRLYELNRHQKIHLGEKPFICDVCNKAFSRTDELNRHKRVHIGYRPFQCDQCQKAFLTNHELTQHKKTHSEEKPFMCHLCPRAFSRQDKLFHHGKIHTGHRSYPCDICDKAFITQSQLNQHKKIHSGEKPFVCEICHKAYLKNNDLNRHMKMHTGQKPYACETCGKAFHRADILTRHKRTHNKVKRGKRSL